MKRSKTLFYNLMLLTATSIGIRFAGVIFNVYITGKIGADGIGLYTLIMSVGSFGVTFATSGINLAATRMTAEALGRQNNLEVRSAMKKCILYALFFGISGMILLLSLACPIAHYLLSEDACVLPLRIFACGLPLIALSSALSGYFTAVARVYKNAVVQVAEQSIGIILTVILLAKFADRGIVYACSAIICGIVLSELCSFTLALVLYLLDLKRNNTKAGNRTAGLTRKMVSIAFPVALSTYVRSGLVTVEHLLIPIGLKKFGKGSVNALGTYGTLQGMVMPIVLFPMALVSAFAGLLVPEIASSLAQGSYKRVDNMVSRVFQLTLSFSIGCAGIMMCFSKELGSVIYNSLQAAEYIRLLAPLIPVMYLDHVTDGMLKGMGEQLYTMKVNIADSLISVVLVYLLLPYMGIYGYILIIFLMELLNSAFSIVRLMNKCEIKPKLIKWIVTPLISVIGATSFTKHLLPLKLSLSIGDAAFLWLNIGVSAALYMFFLRVTLSFDSEDCRWLVGAIK